MTTKKSTPIKAVSKKEKSTLTKIAEVIGEVAGEISVKKDQLSGMASSALKAVKSKIHEATAPNIKAANKASIKVVKKAVPKKAIKVVNKKGAKPSVKNANAIKKAVPKTSVKAAKKVSSARQPVPKVVKKVNRKK